MICVAETDAERGSTVRTWSSSTIAALDVYPGFADAPGYRTVKTIQTGALSQSPRPRRGLSEDELEGPRRRALHCRRLAETVRQQMEELIKTLPVRNIFCLMHVGNMPNDKCHSTRLFAEKVMPHLRNLWPEWKTTTIASG